jgi:hypothetical protein
MAAPRLGAVVLAGLLASCSSSDDETDEPNCEDLTPYDGDCLRLEVPDPDEGMQIHYGPASYSEADMAPFIAGAGDEIVDVQYIKSTNDAPVLFDGYSSRLRPGAHHFIVAYGERDYSDGLFKVDLPPLGFDMLLGIQSGSVDIPTPGLPLAPEDEGLAFSFGAKRQLALNAHFINTTDQPLLREAWVNLHYADPADVTQIAAPIFLIGGLTMAVKPHTRELIKGSAPAPYDLRIVWLFGHFHTHTQRFSAFVTRQGSTERELIYETYDYKDPLYIGYNTLITTPPPDRVAKTPGGLSGILEVKKGDVVEWECDVENNDEITLNFANALHTAEMCCLFGFYAPAPNGETWQVLHP